MWLSHSPPFGHFPLQQDVHEPWCMMHDARCVSSNFTNIHIYNHLRSWIELSGSPLKTGRSCQGYSLFLIISTCTNESWSMRRHKSQRFSSIIWGLVFECWPFLYIIPLFQENIYISMYTDKWQTVLLLNLNKLTPVIWLRCYIMTADCTLSFSIVWLELFDSENWIVNIDNVKNCGWSYSPQLT